jgi:hypothetical protein
MSLINIPGACVGAPVKKQIKWEANGVEHTAEVYIKPLSYHVVTHDFAAMRGDPNGLAGRIAASVCDEKGDPVLTIDQITGADDPQRGALCESLILSLMAAISQVNGLGKPVTATKPKAKRLQQKKNSGVS